MAGDHDEGYEMHDFYEHDSILVTNAKGEHARIRLPEGCEDAWAYIAEAFPKAYDMFEHFDPVTKGERVPTIDDDDELCEFLAPAYHWGATAETIRKSGRLWVPGPPTVIGLGEGLMTHTEAVEAAMKAIKAWSRRRDMRLTAINAFTEEESERGWSEDEFAVLRAEDVDKVPYRLRESIVADMGKGIARGLSDDAIIDRLGESHPIVVCDGPGWAIDVFTFATPVSRRSLLRVCAEERERIEDEASEDRLRWA